MHPSITPAVHWRALFTWCAPPPPRETNRSLGSITSRAAITARQPPLPPPHPPSVSSFNPSIRHLISIYTCIIREVFGTFYLVDICHACFSIHNSPSLIWLLACAIWFSFLSSVNICKFLSYCRNNKDAPAFFCPGN